MLEKMLHHKLLKEGERGQGVVTKRHDQAAESGTHEFSILFEIQGHIKFPDGFESEFKSEWLKSGRVGDIEAGALVPVRYDAFDRAEVSNEEQKAKAIAEADAQAARANAADTPEVGGLG